MTCLAQSFPAFVTTAAPTAMGASDMASRWMLGPPLRDSAAATPPPMIPSEFAGLTTASTFIVVMSDLARWICMGRTRFGVRAASLTSHAGGVQNQRLADVKKQPRPPGAVLRRSSVKDLLELLFDLFGVRGTGH